MAIIPTVRVKADTRKGSRIINESDFNAEVHVLFTEASGRDEMEAKAKELGVSFNKKTSDEVLAGRIAESE